METTPISPDGRINYLLGLAEQQEKARAEKEKELKASKEIKK